MLRRAPLGMQYASQGCTKNLQGILPRLQDESHSFDGASGCMKQNSSKASGCLAKLG